MNKDRSLIRASDIGQWGFCQRAWWLAQVKGATHTKPDRLQHGTAAHRAHGRLLFKADWLQRVGLALAAFACLLASLLLLYWLLG